MADIKDMSVEEIMSELSDRAVEAGAIDSKNQLLLLMAAKIPAESRDALGGAVEDTYEIFIELEDSVCEGLDVDTATVEMLEKAREFGIGYLNGY